MQDPNQGQQPSLNLVKAENEEEGAKSEVLHDMGESRDMKVNVIPKNEQRQSNKN